MFVEKLEDLPEPLRDQFVESEFDGKKGFQHKDTVALSNALRNAKTEKQQLQTKVGEFEQRLTQFEQSKAAEIEAARQKALDEAKSKGDIAAIEQRYQEQMADLEKRTAERVRGEVMKEFQAEKAKSDAAVAVADIVTKLKPLTGCESTVKLIVQARQKTGEDGKVYYTNAEGGASVLDAAGLIAELQNDPAIKQLVQAQLPTNGGGGAKGGGLGGALPKSLKDMTPTEEAIFANTHPERYQELLRQHKG